MSKKLREKLLLVAPKADLSNTSDDEAELLFRVIEEVLHGDRELFDNLNPTERRHVLDWFTDSILTGKTANAIHDTLWERDYKRKPVSIETFFEDDNYMGKVGKNLHPKWKDDLIKVNRPGSKIIEWIFTGSIGSGKTTIAMLELAYKLHCISCLHDPADYYDILSGSLIVFGIYSITKKQVSDAGYFKLRGYVDSSPYFRKEFPRNTKIDSKLEFGQDKLLQVINGSTELHALGLDLFCFAMDEVNFMRVKNNSESGKIAGQAYDLYNATRTRMVSRFMRPGGSVPGLMMLMSSRKNQTSFLEEHLKAVKNSETTHVSDYALWDVKDKYKFTMPRFKVEVGDRVSKSRILKPGDNSRENAAIIDVPGEYREFFDEDIDQSLRDIAGVATFNMSPLISDRQSVFDAFRKELSHPFKREWATLDIQTDTLLDDFFDVKKACTIVNSVWKPRLNPNAPRFIHVDIGLKRDSLGIAMVHLSGYKKTRKARPDGTVSIMNEPCVIVDFVLRVVPPPGSEIELSKVRSFVHYLKALYPITLVTFDGFQSADCIQILKRQKIDSRLFSVDRTEDPYLMLRSALYDRRIFMYAYKILEDELLYLERDPKTGKVDHPQKFPGGQMGSKDVADALCGAYCSAITDPRSLGQPMAGFIDNVSTRIVDPHIPIEMATTSSLAAAAVQKDTVKINSVKSEWEKMRAAVK